MKTAQLRKLVIVMVVAVMTVVGFVSANIAHAAGSADEIHYTIINPTAVTFDWRGTATDLRYGADTNYGTTVTAHTLGSGDAYVPYSSSGPWQEAKVTGLAAATTYHYSIGGSADQTFTTAPQVGDSNFTVVAEGDIGGTNEFPLAGPVQDQIKAIRPTLVLGVGDLTYGNATSQATVDAHFNDVMKWSLNSAYMPIWGNHEWDKSTDNLNNYKGRFDLPNPQSSPGTSSFVSTGGGKDWYWFDAGNTRFIGFPEPYVSATWSDWKTKAGAVMAQAQADPRISFIVTYGHRPAFSSGFHDGDSTLAGIMASLATSYPKYVLNINGHSHDYERTTPQSGVVHITAGTGGSELEQNAGGSACLNVWNVCPAPSYTAARFMRFGVLKLSFAATAIKGEFVCGPAGGGVNDISCSVGSVIDTFTINAPGGSTPPVDNPPVATVSASPTSTAPGNTVVLSATANDTDATPVSKVELYDGATLLTTMTAAPYTYSWNTVGASAGSHTITAKAYDTAGKTGTATTTVNLTSGCSVPTNTIGDATMQLSLPTDTTYKVWARISAPDTTNNSFYMQVDNTNCGVVVGDKSIPANTWTWVNYQNGSDTSVLTMSLKAGAHTVKLYGREAGVQLDQVLFLADNCVPVDKGYNCNSDDTTPPTTSITSPVSSAAVKGATTISANATDVGGTLDKGGVTKVEFYVDGQLAGSDTTSPYSYSWDTSKVSPGNHALTTKAYDTAGNIGTSAIVSVTVSDQGAPTVAVVAPTGGSTVKGNVSLTATATDNVAVTKVDYIVDNNTSTVVGSSTVSPFTVIWDTNAVTNGSHSIQARAYDAAGNVGQSATVNVTVNNDRTAPNTPTNVAGKAVSATEIDLTWGASQDNTGGTGLAGYYVYRNGIRVGGTILSLGYQDMTATANTSYQYTVVAVDNAGNASNPSQPVTVTTPPPADTTPPAAPSNLTGVADSASQITLHWTASTSSDTEGYFVRRDGVVIGQTTDITYVDTTVLPNTTYKYVIIAVDTANNASQPSNTATLSTPAIADSTKPSVPAGLTAQAVNAQVNLSWTASQDNTGGSGLKGYNIYRDNVKIATIGLVTTYGDATVALGSTYAYKVSAFDAAGNESDASNQVTVTISNTTQNSDTTAPTVSITAPSSAATVSGNLTITVNANDNVGVTKVEFYVDNSFISNDLSAPYAASIATSQLTNGNHVLTAKAYDAAANVATSSSVPITVSNQTSGGGSGGTSVLTFTPSDDAEIDAATPDKNFATFYELGADNSPVKNWLVKFNVSGLSNRRVVSVKLQLRNYNESDRGGDFYTTSSSWNENTVTWRNAPASQTLLTSLGAVTYHTIYQVDLSNFVTTDGAYSLRVSSPSTDGSGWSSKETSTSDYIPKLIVTVAN